MRKKMVKVAACALAAVCMLSVPTTNVEAGLLKDTIGKTEGTKVINVKETIEQRKIERRKDFLRRHGASEETIQKLDELHFFEFDLGDVGEVDVSTFDEVIVILEDSNIDINIYFNFITINK